jgi:large subunit ribosomal protein L30
VANSLKITLKRSPIGYEKSQGLTARALGLTKRGMTVTQPDNDSIRGMVFKISHLLEVEEVEQGTEGGTNQ